MRQFHARPQYEKIHFAQNEWILITHVQICVYPNLVNLSTRSRANSAYFIVNCHTFEIGQSANSTKLFHISCNRQYRSVFLWRFHLRVQLWQLDSASTLTALQIFPCDTEQKAFLLWTKVTASGIHFHFHSTASVYFLVDILETRIAKLAQHDQQQDPVSTDPI